MITFEGVLGEQHEVEQHSERPDIDGDAVVRVADDLRCHVLLGPAVRLRPHTADRPREPKISNLIRELAALLLEQYVFRLDIPMNEIPLVDALEGLHDLNNDLDGVLEGEDLSRHFGLEGEEVALFAVLHDNDDEVVGWIAGALLVNSY